MQTVTASQSSLPLSEILKRSLERSQFSASPMPHFGMGLQSYVTVTSPLRKFNDYLSQRAIKAKLRGEKCAAVSAQTIAQLQDCTERTRQAAAFAQQWLDCDYLSRQDELAKQSESTLQPIWQGAIVHVTSSGFLVRLNETGIQGFVDTRHIGEKFSFDSAYMRLSSANHSYELEQQIAVRVASIDAKKHQIALQLASNGAAKNASDSPASENK
jgi:ribonuclease R